MISNAKELEENGNEQNGNKAKLGGGRRGIMEDNSRPPSTCSLEADCNSNTATIDDNDITEEMAWMAGAGGTKAFTYDDLARNLDANLAEIDMEDFRTEDIPSLLALPAAVLCGGEQFASVSGSLLLKLGALDSPLTPHSGSQSDVSMGRSDAPLFSPVREGPLLPSFSVDSLDCESYDEHELLLTCRANRHNYTIAFEGSYVRDSDDSDYHDGAGGSDLGDSLSWPSTRLRLRPPSAVDSSMVQSDFVYTTWSKLKHTNDTPRLKGGNSGSPTPSARAAAAVAAAGGATKCRSLPDLLRRSVSGADEMHLSRLNVSADSDRESIPLFDVQNSRNSSANSSQQSFSLVRLFFQHKGSSQDTSMSQMDTSLEDFNQAPTNRQDPNICVDPTGSKSRTGCSGSIGDLDLMKDDAVLCQKNLMCDTEKCTNVSAPVNTSLSRLQDSLAGEDDDEDVEMVSVEEPVSSGNMAVVQNLLPAGWLRPASNCQSSQSQGTQTKRVNSTETSPIEAGDTQCGVLNNERRLSEMGSQSRLRRTSPGFINNTQGEGTLRHKPNVTIATMRTLGTQIPVHVIDRSVQTSFVEELPAQSPLRLRDKASANERSKEAEELREDQADEGSGQTRGREAVYVCCPNYSLPDLSFLRSPLSSSFNSARTYLVPQTLDGLPSPGSAAAARREPRPRSCPDVDSLRRRGFDHIRDWDSLSLLLPRQVRHMLGKKSDEPDPATDIPHFCRGRRRNRSPPRATPMPPPPLPKRSMSLPTGQPCVGGVDGLPPTSPLPRGILRKTSPSRVEAVPGQRFSLYDLPVKPKEENTLKRHSLQGVWACAVPEPQPCNSSIILGARDNPPVKASAPPPTPPSSDCTSSMPSDMLESPTTYCDHPGCCMCDRIRSKKSVSFSEKVCIRESCTPESGHTPTGSPDTKNCQPHPLAKQDTHICHAAAGKHPRPTSLPDESDLDAPPHEFCISPPRSSSPNHVPRIMDPMSDILRQDKPCDVQAELARKRALISSVADAVSVLLTHFSQTNDPQQKYYLGSSSLTPTCGHKVLDWLCPAILAIVSDGLQPSIYSFFGQIHNSAWRVVEASAQLVGPATRALSDLVVRLNSEDVLRESVHKFNAFIFGLLNIRSLDSWLAFLRSQEPLLHKHYQPHSFLFLSNSAMKPIFNELLMALQPLSLLPFELDLLLEVSRASRQDDKNAKDFQNQQARQAGKPDSDEPWRSPRKAARPRSCVEPVAGNGFSLTDIASHVKRRWSGIQIGSKLLQALDKMVIDPQWVGSVGERPDEPVPWSDKGADYKDEDDLDDDDIDCGFHDEPLPSLNNRSKPDGAAEILQNTGCINAKHASEVNNGSSALESQDNQIREEVAEGMGGENQFRQLQWKWEQLSAQSDKKSPVAESTTIPLTPVVPVSRSRIPRPVSSTRSKLDDSAISLRSSGSGQSLNCHDGAKDRTSNKEEEDAENDAVGRGTVMKNVTDHMVCPPVGKAGAQEGAVASPKRRPAPVRTNSVPLAGKTISSKQPPMIRRSSSPPRGKSNLPRKLAGKAGENVESTDVQRR